MILAELETALRVATSFWKIKLGENGEKAYGKKARLWGYGLVAGEEPLFRAGFLNENMGFGDSTDHCKRVANMARYIDNFPEGRLKQTLLWQIRDGYDFCEVSSALDIKDFPPNKQGFVLVSNPSSDSTSTKDYAHLYYINTHNEPREEIELFMLPEKTFTTLGTELSNFEKLDDMQNLAKNKLWHLSPRQLKIIMESVDLAPLATQLEGEPLWKEEDEFYSLSLYQIFQGVQDRFRGAIGTKNLFFKTSENVGIVVPSVATGTVMGAMSGPAFPIIAPIFAGIAYSVGSGVALWNAHIARDAYRRTRKLHQISNRLHKKDNTTEANNDTENEESLLLGNNSNNVNSVIDSEIWNIADDMNQLSPHQRWMFESRHDIGRDITRLMYVIYSGKCALEYRTLLYTIFNKAKLFSAKEAQSLFMLNVSTTKTTMTILDAIVQAKLAYEPLLDIQLSSEKPTNFSNNTGYIYQEDEQLKYLDEPTNKCDYYSVIAMSASILLEKPPAELDSVASKTFYLYCDEETVHFTIKKADNSLLEGIVTANMLPYCATKDTDYSVIKNAIASNKKDLLIPTRINRIIKAIMRANPHAVIFNETERFNTLPKGFLGFMAYKQWAHDTAYQLYYVNKKQSPMQTVLFTISEDKQVIVNDWISDTSAQIKFSPDQLSGIQHCIAEEQRYLFSQLIDPKILSFADGASNNVGDKIKQEIAILHTPSSCSDPVDTALSKKLEDVECLKAVYKQVSPENFAEYDFRYQWLPYIDSLKETPDIQLAYLVASLKANPRFNCTLSLDKVFSQFARQEINIIDVVYKLLCQEKADKPSLQDMEAWVSLLPVKYQKTIWLTMFTNPTQKVIDWLKKASGVKDFLKKKKESYGEAIWASDVDNDIRHVMHSSSSIFSFGKTRGVGTVISDTTVKINENELTSFKRGDTRPN